MSWVRIDDRFDENPKMARLGPMVWGVWLGLLAYSNRNLTDGFIPQAIAERQGATLQHAGKVLHVDAVLVLAQLIEGGLLEEVPGGFRLHDYLDYQPSREQVLADRERTAARQAEFRARRNGGSNTVTDAVTNTVSHSGPNPNPNPNPNPVAVPNAKTTKLRIDRSLRSRSHPTSASAEPGHTRADTTDIQHFTETYGACQTAAQGSAS